VYLARDVMRKIKCKVPKKCVNRTYSAEYDTKMQALKDKIHKMEASIQNVRKENWKCRN
jgi:7,8-dihydro-6-hydroxymethylpterin-pyrophosphokinase